MSEIKFADKQILGKDCPVFRVSFEHIHVPQEPLDGKGDPKYSLTMLFDKKTTNLRKTRLWSAALAAATEKFGSKFKLSAGGKWPPTVRCPFRDGEEKADTQPAYKGHVFVKATAKDRPPLVDQKLIPVISDEIGREKFYSGCYARATLVAFAYDVNGNKGVSFAVASIQIVKHGEKLGKTFTPENEYSLLESDDENDSEELVTEDAEESQDSDDNMGF